MNKKSKASEAEIRAIITEWSDEQHEKNAVSLSSAMTVNCFPSLPISARVSSSAEQLVLCRLPLCCQTLGRNLGVTRFPSKKTTAKRGTAIVWRALQRSPGRYGNWLGRLPGAFLLHLPRSLTGPQAHVRVPRPARVSFPHRSAAFSVYAEQNALRG